MGRKRHYAKKLKRRRKRRFQRRIRGQQLGKKLQLPEEEFFCDLSIELVLPLSDESYSVYRIIFVKKNVGYFGVYPNGKFYFSITLKNANEAQIIVFIKNYVQKNLNLHPVLNSGY